MKWTNKTQIPLTVAVMYAYDEYPYTSDPNTYSVTTLLKPIKQLIMAKRSTGEPSVQDIASKRGSTRGTAMHNLMEKAWTSSKLAECIEDLGYPKHVATGIRVNPADGESTEYDAYTERRVRRVHGNYIISGECDFILQGHVRDLKTTGVYTYIKGTKEDDYKLQLSMYRWLMPDLITQDEGMIDFIFMDWSAKDSRLPNYPPYPEMTMTIPLLSIEDTEQWINNKLTEIEYYSDKPEEEIPPCTQEDLWAQPAVFKYYNAKAVADGMKRATRNYATVAEADAHMAKDGHTGHIAIQQMKVKFCPMCPAFGICQQAKQYQQQGCIA